MSTASIIDKSVLFNKIVHFIVQCRKDTEYEEEKQQLENQHMQKLAAAKLDHENEQNNLVSA